MTRARYWVLALVIATGCKAKLSGEIKLDGQKFEVSECHNGDAIGFHGVELVDPHGVHLRLVSNADGTTNAIYFAPGSVQGDNLNACGTLTTHYQNSTINNVKNLAGTAALKCAGGTHALEGTLSFENCH